MGGYNSGKLAGEISRLCEEYPFLGSGSFGVSALGSRMPVLRFGTGDIRVLYNASHHANEWITTPLLMRFIENLCAAACKNQTIGGVPAELLYRRVTLYAVPMVNPDGVDLVTGHIEPGSPAYNRAYEIRGELPFPDTWKANIRGVDLNNNYPALFENGKAEKEAAGKNIPGARDYTGPRPLSEPESAAMATLTLRISPALTIALHTQGREIYWRFNGITPQNALEKGEIMASVSGYTLADPPGPSYGGYKDWFIQTYNMPGYTVEAGEGENPLPIDALDGIYEEIEPILLAGML